MQGHLLFFAYYFPPSGGPGVQRALKLVRHFGELGWRTTVVTIRPEDAAYPAFDPTLSAEIPADVRVERTRGWDPYGLHARVLGRPRQETIGVSFGGEAQPNRRQRLARWLRANFFLPDARVGWVPFALARGEALLREGSVDALLTTGPPHSTHLVGRILAARHRLPWVADFRDPWTEHDTYHLLPMSPWARWLDRTLERGVLAHASALTAVGPSLQRRLEMLGGRPCRTITNGFDPADFAGLAPIVEAAGDVRDGGREPRFVLAHVGNVNGARDPEALWRALAALDAPRRLPRLLVRFVGSVDPVVLQSARRHGLEGLTQVEPPVPHADSLQVMRGSTALLLVINRVAAAQGILTGKLFEYLAAGRPVVGLGPPAGDAAAVLRDTGAGQMFDHQDAAGLAAHLEALYTAWLAGQTLAGAPAAAIARYTRLEQAREMVRCLEEVVRAAPAGRSPA